MGKKKAPANLTGGAGFRYEDYIAARFLLDLLAGTNSLGPDFGKITSVDWQARDAGWLADDLAISCTLPNGDRTAGISIKSDRQVTNAGFPKEFVEISWAHWLGEGTSRKLREDKDAVVLVTGRLAQDVEAAWSKTLSEALQTTPQRMVARLSPPQKGKGSQASAVQRKLFTSFRCPEPLQVRDDTDALATVRLLRHIRLLRFDYEAPTSRHWVQAVSDCLSLLRLSDTLEAATVWDRLIRIAADKRAVGGSADLTDLLAGLRGAFDFRDHPDYRRDWEAIDRHSQEAIDDIRTEIPGLPQWHRDAERDKIDQRLHGDGICLLVGESGSGKSALAKDTVRKRYPRVVWVTADALDHDSFVQFEQCLLLRHPLLEILCASPQPCLIVFDGVEGYSNRALRLAARMLRDVKLSTSASHIKVLLTIQFEASHRIITVLAEEGIPISLLEATQVYRPSEDDIRHLVAALPALRWTTLRAEIRPLLTNLKILDWVVRVVQSGRSIDERSIIGLTALIDRLWDRWVEGDDDGFSRSHLLMHLATLEAETLSAGVPRMRLGQAEQQTLPALVKSDLIRVRDERVRFSHDLLGDWARMRVLVGENPTDSPTHLDRAASPRWHRAVRLFGQRLLEQAAQSRDQWRRSVEQLEEDRSDAGNVVHNLFWNRSSSRLTPRNCWRGFGRFSARKMGNCLTDSSTGSSSSPRSPILGLWKSQRQPRPPPVSSMPSASLSGHTGDRC